MLTRTALLGAVALCVVANTSGAQVADKLSAGTARYHLVEQSTVQNSMTQGPPNEIRRDLFVVVTLKETTAGLDATITVDSAIVTTSRLGRAVSPAFAGASWRGTLTSQGKRATGAFALADGSATTSPVVTSLLWALPMVPAGANQTAADTLDITTTAQSGATRVLRYVRTFSRDGTNAVSAKGIVRRTSSDLRVNDTAVNTNGDGTFEGRWGIANGQVTESAVRAEISATVNLGGNEMKTTERTLITLTKLL